MEKRDLEAIVSSIFGTRPTPCECGLCTNDNQQFLEKEDNMIPNLALGIPEGILFCNGIPVGRIGGVSVPKPVRVIFSNPATIVFWDDGDKTVVKCENDEYSEEFGFAMAFMRKVYGSRSAFKKAYNRVAERPSGKK